MQAPFIRNNESARVWSMKNTRLVPNYTSHGASSASDFCRQEGGAARAFPRPDGMRQAPTEVFQLQLPSHSS